MIDVLMKFREPRYRTLFKEWNLDSATADLTLKIIRDKESHTKAALREFRKDGISGVKKAAEAFDEEAQMSPIQLTGLLGEDHFKELSRREAEMDGDETTISVNFDVPRINRADLPIAHRKYKSQ